MTSVNVFANVEIDLDDVTDRELVDEMTSRGYSCIKDARVRSEEPELYLGYGFKIIWERDLLDLKEAALIGDRTHLSVCLARVGLDA